MLWYNTCNVRNIQKIHALGKIEEMQTKEINKALTRQWKTSKN